jgi:HK97 gp10 family phage protein
VASIRVDLSELNRLAATLDTDAAVTPARARLAVRRSIAAVTADAKRFAPVDTGNLRASIGYETAETPTGAIGESGPTADYGLYVELGTSRMAPHAYMGPAFDRHAGEFVDALEQLGPW